MAVITLTQYAAYPSDSLTLLISWWTSNLSAIDGTTVSIGWVPGGPPNGGAFVLNATAVGGANTYVTTIHATELNGVTSIPLRLILQNGSWTRNVSFNFGESALHLMRQFTDPLNLARQACIQSCTGATIVSNTTREITFPGKTNPYFVVYDTLWSTATDCGVDQMSCTNQSEYSTVNNISNTYIPTYSGIPFALIAPASSGGDNLPLDLDISINNAANMFSVFGRTFTEPGNR